MAEPEPELPPITFVAAGKDPKQQAASLEMVMPSPGYPTSVQLVAGAVARRADLTVLDFSSAQVTIRFQIDGIWHTMPPMDRQTGDYMLATLKQLAGLNYRDRRNRQEGNFSFSLMRKRFDARMVTQGIRTGERAAIYFDAKKKEPLETLEQMGMRPRMIEQLEGLLANTEASMVLTSGLPGEGTTTFWRGVLGAADRFTRDYYVIEEKSRVEPEVINITGISFDESQGEDAFTPIPQLLLKQPNVLVFPEVLNGEMLDQICELSQKENLPMIVRNSGKNCPDSLMRLIAMEPNMSVLAEMMTAVVSMRLIRKLCENCRIPFRPNPIFLQKLGIPAGRVHHLYKAFEHRAGMVDEQGQEIPVCPECNGIGYLGRTGLFELLQITDPLRGALLATPQLNKLNAILQKMRHVSMRNEAVVLVAKGTTSVEEIQRVLNK